MKRLQFKKELYSKTALLKSAYNFTDVAYIHLDSNNQYYYVDIIPKNGSQEISEEEFMNEMLAQSVRHEIYLQTKNIRELMVARAVSSSLIVDEQIANEEFTPKEKFSEDAILKDWFESNGMQTE